MSTPTHPSAALPIAHVALRVLVVVNWLVAGAILTLLVAMPTERWIIDALDLQPGADTDRLLAGFTAIAVLGLCAAPLNYIVLKRLIAVVETVRDGDPFVPANAARLQAIAWTLLGLQLLSLAIGGVASSMSTAARPINVDAGFSINGWLAVMLTFLLARVFSVGTRMREDLEGTV